jgi:hypothetical protein
LDVSLAKTAICVISEHGHIVNEAQVASEPEALVTWIGELDGSIAAVGLDCSASTILSVRDNHLGRFLADGVGVD